MTEVGGVVCTYQRLISVYLLVLGNLLLLGSKGGLGLLLRVHFTPGSTLCLATNISTLACYVFVVVFWGLVWGDGFFAGT